MILWLTGLFVRTPPHPSADGEWSVGFERREWMTLDGTYCSWEAESLKGKEGTIWGADPPEGESWCTSPFESSRAVDVLGKDGPYVSVRLTDWGCCPDHQAVTRCVTYDVRTGQPATLDEYDAKAARWRHRRVDKLLTEGDHAGWTWDPSAFVVGDGHVRLCLADGDRSDEFTIR